jgi:hypothetical protein
MRKLISCWIVTTAILTLTMSLHASPPSAMGRAGLHSAAGAGPVILIVDENDIKKKKALRARAAGQKQQKMMQQMQQYMPQEYQQYLQQGTGGMGGGAMDGGGPK